MASEHWVLQTDQHRVLITVCLTANGMLVNVVMSVWQAFLNVLTASYKGDEDVV